MRSSTLVTALTGVVAVLVLIYGGLSAMHLQPRITFGDPSARTASAVPAKGQAGTEPSAPAPVVEPARQAAAAPVTSVNPPPETTDKAGSPAEKAPPSPPSAAESSAPAPVPPAVPSPPVVTAVPPKAPVPATDPAAPEPAAPAPAPVAQPPAASADAPVDKAVALSGEQGASEKKKIETPAEADAPQLSAPTPTPAPPPADTSVTERMAAVTPSAPAPAATETPPTPAVPALASVPKPLARPEPPAEEATGTASAQMTPPTEDASPEPSAASKSPDEKPAETAALTPQPGNAETTPETAPEKPGGELKPVDLARPFAERAGVLTIGGRSIQIAGIVPTDPQRSCTGQDGKPWPCGTLARTALRSFLLGRTITCDVADPAWTGTVTAECRFAKVNLGDWLVRSGWAEAAAGSPLTPAADEARNAGRGLWGNDPRQQHQSTLAPAPPKEDPLNPI
jgi:endonuclease YncB( thermonuclease family)